MKWPEVVLEAATMLFCLSRGLTTFSVNVFSLAGPTASATAAQLCRRGRKAALDAVQAGVWQWQ